MKTEVKMDEVEYAMFQKYKNGGSIECPELTNLIKQAEAEILNLQKEILYKILNGEKSRVVTMTLDDFIFFEGYVKRTYY